MRVRVSSPRYRWLLARGAVQPGVGPRVGGGAFAPGPRLARPRGPLGAPPSHHALAWLPFSGTTVMVRPAAGRIGEWTCLDPSACFGVALFRHEIVGYKGHGLVRERVLPSPPHPVPTPAPLAASCLSCPQNAAVRPNRPRVRGAWSNRCASAALRPTVAGSSLAPAVASRFRWPAPRGRRRSAARLFAVFAPAKTPPQPQPPDRLKQWPARRQRRRRRRRRRGPVRGGQVFGYQRPAPGLTRVLMP